jgi:hypothetical protein
LCLALHSTIQICWPVLKQLGGECDTQSVMAVAEVWNKEGCFSCEVKYHVLLLEIIASTMHVPLSSHPTYRIGAFHDRPCPLRFM